MPDTKADLDAKIAAMVAINANLIAAIEAVLNKPADDFTPEDTALQGALDAAQAEINKINPPPPPAPQP